MHCPTKHEPGQLNKHGVVLACASAMREGSGRLPGAVGNGRVYSASGPGHSCGGKCNTTYQVYEP